MRFFTQGYQQDLHVVLNNAIFTEDSDEMVRRALRLSPPLLRTARAHARTHAPAHTRN
jgi:hypothetical protein